jgi:hypothetical protein
VGAVLFLRLISTGNAPAVVCFNRTSRAFEKIPGSLHIHRRKRFDLALGRFILRQRDWRTYL